MSPVIEQICRMSKTKKELLLFFIIYLMGPHSDCGGMQLS